MDTVGKSKRTALGFAVYHHRFAIDTEGVRDQWRAQGVPNDVPYEIHGGTFVATEAYFYARYALARSGASPSFWAAREQASRTPPSSPFAWATRPKRPTRRPTWTR